MKLALTTIATVTVAMYAGLWAYLAPFLSHLDTSLHLLGGH